MPRPSKIPKVCTACGQTFLVPPCKAKRELCSRACRSNMMRHIDDSAGEDACWPWRGPGDGYGKYGRATEGGKTYGAHAYVYRKLVGVIPAGKELDHLCRNPICVNPRHLEPVTRRENVLRQPKVIAARQATHCRHGHEFTPANTYIHPSQGSRICRACTNISIEKYQARRKSNQGVHPHAHCPACFR